MITKDTMIKDILADHPEVESVFKQYGIQCFGWGGVMYKSVGYAAQRYGIEEDILLKELNKHKH